MLQRTDTSIRPDYSNMPDDAAQMRGRRLFFGALVSATVLALLALMAWTLSPLGLSAVDLALLTLFGITLPWTVIGFWNAVIGLWLMRLTRDPVAAVNPYFVREPDWRRARGRPMSRTAILSCIRNEDLERVIQNLETMLNELRVAGVVPGFSLHVLSDSDWPNLVDDEERAFDRLRLRWAGIIDVSYRRRPSNPGFKAGNIGEFLSRQGDQFDYALVLDADSVMSVRAILRLRQMMEDNPRLGIAQSLVTGLPSASLFARVFQFGMRLGMRSYTLGSAWWQGDCGPYWGHNAMIRLAPFMEHCKLPQLPGKGPLSGWILSHDQVEAVLMRRAGYEVRVIPMEDGSFEENPPNLLEFIRRDLRWCHGNMQYFHLLKLDDLKPVSRVQLILAILMFVGSPAWLGFVCLSSLSFIFGYDSLAFRGDIGMTLFAIIMTMVFAPKLATIVDVIASSETRKRFGGGARALLSSLTEVLFSMLIAPIMAIAHTVFMGGLLFGHKKQWPAQHRDAGALPWAPLFAKLWPQMLFGLLGFTWFAAALSMGLNAWLALPMIVGPAIAVLIGWVTAWPQLGYASHRLGLWLIPEETSPPETIVSLGLPILGTSTAALAIEPNNEATVLEAAE